MYDDKMLELYQHMVRERHQIWLARQHGDPYPWTEDPVLANRKFTNMFRVLDPGSQFVFDLDGTDLDPADLITRLVFYRITNLPETWYAMRNMYAGRYPVASDFIRPGMADNLITNLSKYRDAGNKIFSGAYIIVPEPGTKNDKVAGAVRVTQHFALNNVEKFLSAETQAARFAALRATPGLGKFLSMQILTDWTYLLEEEPDLSFVVAGPGAVRGAELLNSHIKPEKVVEELAVAWADHLTVRIGDRGLTPMDVQNTLCEFSKYAREVAYPRKKTPYKPAHPGVQPKPRLPQWW